MKLAYNLGGINHACDALRIDHRSYKQRSFTSSKKVQILQAVDRLVEEENLPQNVGAGRLGINPSNLSKWRQNKTALSAGRRGLASARNDKILLGMLGRAHNAGAACAVFISEGACAAFPRNHLRRSHRGMGR
jgi:hypothetical protein